MKPSRYALLMFVLGAVSCIVSVAAAAFASHGAATVAPGGALAAKWFALGSDFQLSHSIGFMLIAFVSEFAERGPPRTIMQTGAVILAVAAFIFPGSLYWASFGGSTALAPAGGFAAMGGWALFGLGALISLVRKRTYL